MNNIFDDLASHWRHDRANPAAIPPIPAAPATPTTGGHVKLAELANDTAATLTDGKAWIDHTVTVKLPALLAEVQRLQASPIVQALEGITLSPASEQAIAAIVNIAATADGVASSHMSNEVAEPAAQPDEPAEHVA